MTEEHWSHGCQVAGRISKQSQHPHARSKEEAVLDDSFYIMFNAHHEPLDYVCPRQNMRSSGRSFSIRPPAKSAKVSLRSPGHGDGGRTINSTSSPSPRHMMQAVAMNTAGSVNFTGEGTATVRLWAPKLKKCTSGSGPNPLLPEAHGYWTLTTPNLQPGDDYEFITQRQGYAGPASLCQPQCARSVAERGPRCLCVDRPQIGVNPSQDDYISELHVRTFSAAKWKFSGLSINSHTSKHWALPPSS